MAGTRHYDGDDIRVTYDARRCIHAAECVRGLPVVFDPERRPWIDATAAQSDEIAAVVHRCPTGALSCTGLDGSERETPPAQNVLVVAANGPVFATGNLTLVDAERRPLSRQTRVALCRCGASSNKPFCDGRHAEVGFDDAGKLGTSSVRVPEEATAAALTIRLRENGPLVLDGRYMLRAADEVAIEGATGALCRCGASSNKPFCDGTHRDIGFEPEDPSSEDA
jgi:CDGSH-type Zn-finger protein/uncharacterized Fe-S cluster protein YjdI